MTNYVEQVKNKLEEWDKKGIVLLSFSDYNMLLGLEPYDAEKKAEKMLKMMEFVESCPPNQPLNND